MPLPLLFIGIAVATGALGVGKSVKAGVDTANAKFLNKSANDIIEDSRNLLDQQRTACSDALSEFGEEKLFVLNNTMTEFLDGFQKIKNVDFSDVAGFGELKEIHIDKPEFQEMKALVTFAASMGSGAALGTAGGALIAFGAYGAAQALACASTGTAIATLSGAAATNATLAFFGGGSLAAGGLGMAGGTAVLGGLVAGPALMAMGFVAGHFAKKELDKAKTNKAEAIQIAIDSQAASMQCELIRRKTYVLYNLLARLDTYFLPLIYKMEDILVNEGDDYRMYSPDSKKVIASCASIAVSIKAVLDTPLLTEEGTLTDKSEETAAATAVFLEKNEKQLR